VFSPELKKGSVELMVLTLLSEKPNHGYQIGKLIELRSGGQIQFNISSLYPILCRLENRGWIRGQWVEKSGERRRCFYHLTAKGETVLAEQLRNWEAYTEAVNLVIGVDHA